MSSSKKKAAASPKTTSEVSSSEENAVISDLAQPQSQQPIPPPSEPLQFRAIGLLQGVYIPSEEQFNRGQLVTREGLHLDAVLLGQVMSLVKKYLDLALPHLWVVYPRTRNDEPMHVQLVGVWSPEGFTAQDESEIEGTDLIEASLSPLESLEPPLKDGFFSVRGQVIQQDPEAQSIFVKIQQTSRKKSQTAKAFKVKLQGKIPQKPMGYFWDFEVVREGEMLKIEKATPIQFIPMKKKKNIGPPRRKSTEGDSRKPIKKTVPLGQEPGQVDKSSSKPKFSSATKAKEAAPSRPLPKIIPQDSD